MTDAPLLALAAPDDTLHRLLDEAQPWPPEYAPGLSNHLPMALVALAGLGASEAQSRRFFASYTAHFKHAPTVAAPALPLAAWTAERGNFAAFDRLRASFAAAIAREGRSATARAALPALIDGSGAAAFHGVIRTAHAIDSGHDGELAAGLAYWAARWMPLDPPPPPTAGEPSFERAADWLDALDAAVRDADAGWRSSAPLISIRMQEAVRTRAYRLLGGRLGRAGRAPAAVLRDLAAAAAARYALTGNFTVLHMTTAARAALTLAPLLPADDEAALAPLWHAFAAASLASRVATTPLPDEPAPPALSWAEVGARARASDDDHVIKLVHGLATLRQGSDQAVWLQAARRAVRNLPAPAL